MSQTHEVIPSLVDGSAIRRISVSMVGIYLFTPILLYLVATFLPIELGIEGRRRVFVVLDLLGILVLINGSYYLLKQYFTRIRLGNSFEINSSGIQKKSNLALHPLGTSDFICRRLPIRNKRFLQIIVVLGCILLFCFCLYQFLGVFALFLEPLSGISRDSRGFDILAIWTLFETFIFFLDGLLVLLLCWRIMNSGGILILWLKDLNSSQSKRLRIFAETTDLDQLKAWLIEHGIREKGDDHWNSRQ